MPNSTESLRSIFERALLAKAAYADLTGVAFTNRALLIERLTETGNERMPQYAAAYLANRFGVLHHQPDTASGYSGTLFARRGASGEVLADFTFALRGTNAGWDYYSWATIAGSGAAAAEQQWDMYRQWAGLISDTSGYITDESIRSALRYARVNVTGHSLGGNLTTLFSVFRPESFSKAFTFNFATESGRER